MAFTWPPRNKTIWIAGDAGMVGQALTRRFSSEPCRLLTAPRASLDLRRQADVEVWLSQNRPDAVIVAAATVGGIADNAARPADFLYDNLMIAANIIEASHRAGIDRLLFLGSSCIYPRDAPQPIQEDALLTGPLEPTNEAYALAKIAGIKLCQSYRRQYGRSYIAAMPCNLYGPGDRFDAARSHVVPALLMKMHRAAREDAAKVTLWGTGNPLREFLHVDDLADALLLLLRCYDGDSPVNVGGSEEISIAALARLVAAAVGYRGVIDFDPSMPDGTPRKLMDSSRMRALGWTPRIGLEEGLRGVYQFYLAGIGG
jgi:GDP-L-fucose synthase